MLVKWSPGFLWCYTLLLSVLTHAFWVAKARAPRLLGVSLSLPKPFPSANAALARLTRYLPYSLVLPFM